MTLADLWQTVLDTCELPPGRLRNLPTSIAYLARALGYASPEHCPQSDFWTPESAWSHRLKLHFRHLAASPHEKTPSAHTLRNTLNNLRYLFRLVQTAQILSPPKLPSRQESWGDAVAKMQQTSPYRHYYTREKYGLKLDDWPESCATGWKYFVENYSFHLREQSLETYRSTLERYVGFHVHIRNRELLTWDDLFQVYSLKDFIQWHASQHEHLDITKTGHFISMVLSAIAKHTHHPQAVPLSVFTRTLPSVEAVHQKRNHWFTLSELEDIGLGMLQDADHMTPSSQNSALMCQRGLILRLILRIPLRHRNVRDMRLDKNLYQDHNGHWRLEFKGRELKVSRKNGKTHEASFDLTENFPDIIDHLNLFLKKYRPLLERDPQEHVFINRQGRPFSPRGIHMTLTKEIYARTGKRFYLHLVRTIWATEYISATRDFTTAAYMLGDEVQTVLRQYQEIFAEEHVSRAQDFLRTALGASN